MTTSYTSLLGLALPATGELSGTWGDTVNNAITSLLDTAIAGTTTLSSDADVTLTTTTGASNQARQAIILWTANGTATRTITAPAQSKSYLVVNASAGTQSIKLVGAGPTTGVTLLKGEAALCVWNGSDFIKLSNTAGSATFTGLTVTGLTASQAVFTDGSKNLVSNAITGSGNVVMSTSPTLVTPILGTPSSGTLTSCTGLPISTGVSGLGTSVATALAVNVGSAGAFVVNGGALGTPSSGTVTNLTGTASININGTVGATTPAAGSFTTLSATGNVTFGDSAGDMVTVNGGTITLGAAATSTAQIDWTEVGGSSINAYRIINAIPGVSNTGLTVRDVTNSRNMLMFDSAGLASFGYGLAVTGAFSASGALTVGNTSANTVHTILGVSGQGSVVQFKSNTTETLYITAGGNYNAFSLGQYGIGNSAGSILIAPSNTIAATFTSTGLAVTGALSCTGALSKGSGSFRIEHPLPQLSETHQLVHSFIEGPQADLIYRGKVTLVDGMATVNIDSAARMTEGTFDVLCRNIQCFTTNESDWTPVRGSVSGNVLTIEAQDKTSSASISWMVIGERKDKHIMETDWTDDDGRVIVEPLKPVDDVIQSAKEKDKQ
jgi:hypothetical protein